ncbi:MAG: 4-hydroxythreonine-4-phosphate dehydrogenase PdxA [Phycisphaerales bacterium]
MRVDGRENARIAVAGLNPHAGEHGLLGPEDDAVIRPAVEACAAKGMLASGPWPGDTVFGRALKGEFDAVVAMYHDQGLIPVKLIDGAKSVNVTVGLSWEGRRVVRTSPAHGTAFDIAGTGKADPTSMIAAVKLAAKMARGTA